MKFEHFWWLLVPVLLFVYLLRAWRRKSRAGSGLSAPSTKPSTLYQAKLWSAGVTLCRWLPSRCIESAARLLGRLYFRIASHRRKVVVQNLLPLLEHDSARAELVARELFSNFASKVADLWRYEGGESVWRHLTASAGWEHFEAATARGTGVLLVTPHLGNWEFGAPFLTHHGKKLLVLTQAEPDERLTQMRLSARARWGIETLVVGQDEFSFIEIIKRLHEGATVALLIDRPVAATGVTVEILRATVSRFGRRGGTGPRLGLHDYSGLHRPRGGPVQGANDDRDSLRSRGHRDSCGPHRTDAGHRGRAGTGHSRTCGSMVSFRPGVAIQRSLNTARKTNGNTTELAGRVISKINTPHQAAAHGGIRQRVCADLQRAAGRSPCKRNRMSSPRKANPKGWSSLPA